MRSRVVRDDLGFTLIEVMMALVLTLIISSAVFALLTRGQKSFRREPAVSALNQNVRSGLARISRDLVMAGYLAPGPSAVLWQDGGRDAPDNITIIHADPESTVAESVRCGWGEPLTTARPVCPLLADTSTLRLDVDSMDPVPADPMQAFPVGTTLLAIEQEDCNYDDLVGVFALEVVGSPTLTLADSSRVLTLDYQWAETNSQLKLPSGFNTEVRLNCALVGHFNVIQYRIHAGSSADEAPNLERRDVALGEPWIPVSLGVENLQFQYMTIDGAAPVDIPSRPHGDFPETWISGVRVALAARSEARYLEGSTRGTGTSDEGYLRKHLSTAVSLRNVAARAASFAVW